MKGKRNRLSAERGDYMEKKNSQRTGALSPAPAQRNYKDTVFRMLFRDRTKLLELYNAVNGTQYTDPGELEEIGLENAVYMSVKNDVSCVMDLRLNLYEHQSTVNPNMPLRDLFYVSRLYEKMIQKEKKDLHSGKRIMIPAPRFVVFYNGTKEQPGRKILRLSESFYQSTDEVNLELIVLQLNINPGYNEEILEKCHTLNEYAQYVDRVRRYSRELDFREAVEKAVTECIKEGILREFLTANRAEVVQMSIFEYDEELHMATVREEGREEGRQEGLKEGREEGWQEGLKEGREEGRQEGLEEGIARERSRMFARMRERGLSPEEAGELMGDSVEVTRK